MVYTLASQFIFIYLNFLIRQNHAKILAGLGKIGEK